MTPAAPARYGKSCSENTACGLCTKKYTPGIESVWTGLPIKAWPLS